MTYNGIFKNELSPIAKYGENLYLIPLKEYYRVIYVYPLPGETHDFGALIAGASTTSYTQVTDMNMSEDELAQWRVKLLDDISIQVKQKQGVGHYITKDVMESLVPGTAIYSNNGNMFEMYVFEDEAPWMSVTNNTNYTIKKSRIFFEGFRYILEKITEEVNIATAIPIYGWGTRA